MPDLVVDNILDPARGLALDEALARALPGAGGAPRLRLWQCAPAVMVGRFQPVEPLVDMVACARDAVPVLRRVTGGGPLFCDPGSLNLTLVTAGHGGPDARALLGTVVAETVRRLGLPATARGASVVVDGARLSGIAVRRTRHAVLAHAGLRVTTPQWLAHGYLTEAARHGGTTGSLIEFGLRVGVAAVREEAYSVLVARCGQVVPRRPSGAETAWARHLAEVRYTEVGWNLTGHLARDPLAARRGPAG